MTKNMKKDDSIWDKMEDTAKDVWNGYTGGHGTRILIRAFSFSNYDVPNKNDPKNDIKLDRNFELTVFNWNPNSFNTKSEYKWNDGGKESGAKTGVKQFQLRNTVKTLTIEGTIFNEGIDSLSTLEADLISKAPLEAEIKEFEKYANSGVIFLLVEPTEMGGKEIGTFYVESFEYTQSEFIYSNKAQKTVFKIIFKEYI